MERVSIVVPNWNGADLLAVCLESVRRQTFREFVVYVIDNGSTDGSIALMTDHFPEVRVVQHGENLGFAAAMNSGIAASKGEYIVALNNDTEAEPTWLAELVKLMDDHPSAGFGGSKLLNFSERNLIDTIGDGYSANGLSFKIGSRQQDNKEQSEPFEVFGASAAAAIYRRKMLDEIGCFDNDFFAYMEDVDLSIRARLAGYDCLTAPAAIVYHKGAASTGGSATAFSVRHTTRNIFSVIIKNIPAPLLPWVITLTLATQIGAVAQCLLTRRNPWLRRNLRAYGQGLLETTRSVPRMLRKRRVVQRLRRISSGDFARLMAESKAMRRRFETGSLRSGS